MSIQDEVKLKQPKPVLRNDFGRVVKKKKKSVLPKKGDNFSDIMRKIVWLAAVVTLLASMYILFDYFKQIYDAKKLNENLANLKNSVSESVPEPAVTEPDAPRPLLPVAQTLLEQNPDTVGWIKINNTRIDLPVVMKTDEPDGAKNDYYLTHNFNRESARVGTIFVDYRSTITDRAQSDNLVLYGHNEMSNEMFGDLDLYKQKNAQQRWTQEVLDFYKANPTFEFSTNYEVGTYKIFAYFVTVVNPEQDPKNPIFDYVNYIDFDEARYNDFMDNIMKRNMIVTDIDCQFGDKFVTLSTCAEEFEPSRFVVFGRKVREGESTSVNTDTVIYNKNALKPDYDYIYSGKNK